MCDCLDKLAFLLDVDKQPVILPDGNFQVFCASSGKLQLKLCLGCGKLKGTRLPHSTLLSIRREVKEAHVRGTPSSQQRGEITLPLIPLPSFLPKD